MVALKTNKGDGKPTRKPHGNSLPMVGFPHLILLDRNFTDLVNHALWVTMGMATSQNQIQTVKDQ